MRPVNSWRKMLPDFIAKIPFPKSMHWSSYSVTFARPIQWIVALLGQEVLECEYAQVRSGKKSMGHRFMSPVWIEVNDLESHRENLRKNSRHPGHSREAGTHSAGSASGC